jgi:hypothetical protein
MVAPGTLAITVERRIELGRLDISRRVVSLTSIGNIKG